MSSRAEGRSQQELQLIDGTESEFIDSTIAKIVKENAFGQAKLVSIIGKKDSSDEGRHFMSKVDFKTVVIIDEAGKEKEVPLVIKIQVTELTNIDKGMAFRAQCMFSNEMNMFNDILPRFHANDIELFPHAYYCESGTSARTDIVIMEDLTKQNFRLLELTVNKRERMSFLVRKLGQFHGLCYRAKKQNPSVIDHLKTVLKRTKHFSVEGLELAPMHKGHPLIIAELLTDESGDLKKLMNCLRSERDILVNMRSAEEPFAAIVHADLFNSNILVRSSEDDRITDARFIDLQTCSYSDPVFDFSFLIYLCASVDLLEQHWDDFVLDYWNGIISVEPQPGFNFEEMKNNIDRKALGGFMDACFFIPMVMTPPEKLAMAGPPGPCDDTNIEKAAKEFISHAPAEAVSKMVSILKFAVKRGFVQKALEFDHDQ